MQTCVASSSADFQASVTSWPTCSWLTPHFASSCPRIPGSLLSPRLAVASPILSAALHLQREGLLPPTLSLSRSLTPMVTKSFSSGHHSTGHTWSQLSDLLHLTLPALKPYLLWHPHSYLRCWVLPPRPPLKLTSEADPLYPLPKTPDHYKLPDPQLGKDTHSRKHSIAPEPINHLTPTFQQEFYLSWGFKTWLLTHENCRPSLVRREIGSLCSQCPRYLCSLFLINSLPSEMLCIWKFFSNLHWDWLNVRPAPILHRHTVISFVVSWYCFVKNTLISTKILLSSNVLPPTVSYLPLQAAVLKCYGLSSTLLRLPLSNAWLLG